MINLQLPKGSPGPLIGFVSVTEETTLAVSFVTWVGVFNVSIVGHDKSTVSLILNSILNVWSIIDFWYWWKALPLQVTLIGLLGDKQLDLSSNFLTDFNSFCISLLRIKSRHFYGIDELGSLGTK